MKMTRGEWEILELGPPQRKRQCRAKCPKCGDESKWYRLDSLSGSRPRKSCGCYDWKTTHGHTVNLTSTKEWRAWHSMIGRCIVPTNQSYSRYGGRGIQVCNSWLVSFLNFLEDMGYAPSPQHSIDRIDNDGNYEPNNVRWATPLEQANNTRITAQVTAFGKTQGLAAWGREYAMPYYVIATRMKRGLSAEEALTKPYSKRKSSKKERK